MTLASTSTRTQCTRCDYFRISIRSEKEKGRNHRKIIRQLKVHMKKQTYKRLNEQIKRKNMTILRLKGKLALKSDKNLKRRTKYKEMTYKKSILNDLQLSEEKRHTVANYENIILELEETIAGVSEKGYTKELTQKSMEDNRTCSISLRMFVYSLLDANTSTAKIPDVLSMIFENNQIPQRTTIERMASEMGMLSDMQVCVSCILKLIYFKCSSILYEVPNLTLCFDASTQEGVHFNVISITTAHSSYMFGLDQLAVILHIIYLC